MPVENDDQVRLLLEAETPVVTIVRQDLAAAREGSVADARRRKIWR